ncbi:MAG TPA: acyltransferase family protein, partial [Steroidobacteraceae bacterium]|nr:acyltransferase family protein [Steroidobacteraceae bacterium]
LALTAAAFVFTDTEHFPFPWALAAVVGTVCIIRSVADTPVPWLRPLAGIGAISYSLYLWHYPVYVLLRWTAGLNTPLEMSAAVLLTFGLALASYRLVEQPFRHRGRGLQPALVMAIGVACAVLSWGFATQIIVHRYRLSLSTVTHNAPEWYPAPWGSQSDNGPCHITFTVETKWPPDSRLYASRGHCPARRMLFVSGNSHALAYSQMLGRFTLEQPYDVRIYYHPACAFMNLDHPMVSDEDSACRQFYTDVENELKAFAGRGDVVFLPSLRLPRFGDQWTLYDRPDLYDKRSQAERKAQREAAVQEAEDLVALLAARGVRVIIEAPKPIFRAPAFRCADWYERTNPICAAGTHMPRTELIAYRQPVVRAMAAIRGAEVWDPFDLLCPGNPCGVTSAGHPLYFDGDHVSGYANERLYPSFLQAIAGNAALRGATRPPQHP